jgi:hypothetical protein
MGLELFHFSSPCDHHSCSVGDKKLKVSKLSGFSWLDVHTKFHKNLSPSVCNMPMIGIWGYCEESTLVLQNPKIEAHDKVR